MRAATRALGGTSAHRTRLKGATARRVRRFPGTTFPRGSCAFQARVFARTLPQAAAPHGVIFVPHFMREHGDEGIPAFGREAGDFSRPRGEAPRGTESNPLKSPKSLFLFEFPPRASETLTLLIREIRAIRGFKKICGNPQGLRGIFRVRASPQSRTYSALRFCPFT